MIPSKDADLDRIGKALQHGGTSLLQARVHGGCRGAGDKDLSRPCKRSDARREMHAATCVLASRRHRSIGMEADPDRGREPMLDAVSSQTLLQSDGAAYCVPGLIEGGEDTVAGPVHDFPAVLADDLLDEAIVPFEEMAPGLIAEGARSPSPWSTEAPSNRRCR